jgi:hypothetical protein
MMPSKGTQSRESFLFTMPQSDLKNVSYRGSSFYDSFELICHDVETTPIPHQPSSPIPVAPAVPVAVPVAPTVPPPPPPPPAAPTNATATQKRHLTKRSVTKIQDEIKIHKCHSHGQEIDCSQLQLVNKNQPSECVRLNSESMSKTPTSMSIESKRPLWLILQHQSDDFEQSVQLIPGLKHDVDILAGGRLHSPNDQSNLNKRCGPAHLRHRRCTTSCKDRLAVDSCGCTLTQDLDPESALALLSVPICDEEKLRSCVHPHMEQGADIYFDCMKECKSDCSPTKNPFTLKNKATSLEDIWAKDMIEMNLSYLNAASSSVNSRPITSEQDAHQFIYVWIPIMVIAVVLVAFVLCYCARRLM